MPRSAVCSTKHLNTDNPLCFFKRNDDAATIAFGPGFIDKLQKALIDCKDKEVLTVLKREEGLIEAKNEDFENIVTIAKELGFFKE